MTPEQEAARAEIARLLLKALARREARLAREVQAEQKCEERKP